ncbi:MAG: NADP-dependent aldehyde dehydrogenase, partial [Pseudonocardiales bacterium]|nr:NADP-dependent aldehyde dehydrogenase [Pseudonocardiales bacterium]
ACELPRGSFALVRGMAPARSLVIDHRTRAGAFTGSAAGGRALFDLAVSRPDPIPFFAELGSVNPVFVTPAGAADPDALARGWVDSLLVRAGQMCTNPGLLVVPAGSAVAERSAELLGAVEPGPLLTPGIARAYLEHVGIVGAIDGASVLRAPSAGRGATVSPGLIRLPATAALAAIDEVQTECFGPSGVVIEYSTPDEALTLAERLHGTLVASVHGDAGEQLAAALVPALARIAGRVLWNGWPTGVAVVPAQQHGGPWPATTNPQYTSVGAEAIHRFLRPVAYQDMPAVLLPPQLRDPDGAE